MSVRRLALEQPESFAFTPENIEWAKGQIAKYPPGRQASAVIPLLWQAQKQHGFWLPRAAIEVVAQMLDMLPIRVMEVATFYTMFNLEPVGQHFVQVCGTVPCHLVGALDLKKVCEQRIGPQRQVTPDGKFAWLEVECLGACCNGPMVQINEEYYEDLTVENFNKLLDDIAAGRPVKRGSQTGRVSSESIAGKGTTLTDETLYDGSRVGQWQKRFEEEQAREREAADKAAAEKAAADQAPLQASKPARPAAVPDEAHAGTAPKEARAAADKAGVAPGQPDGPRPAPADAKGAAEATQPPVKLGDTPTKPN